MGLVEMENAKGVQKKRMRRNLEIKGKEKAFSKTWNMLRHKAYALNINDVANNFPIVMLSQATSSGYKTQSQIIIISFDSQNGVVILV